jgi:hypothetical protein
MCGAESFSKARGSVSGASDDGGKEEIRKIVANALQRRTEQNVVKYGYPFTLLVLYLLFVIGSDSRESGVEYCTLTTLRCRFIDVVSRQDLKVMNGMLESGKVEPNAADYDQVPATFHCYVGIIHVSML